MKKFLMDLEGLLQTPLESNTSTKFHELVSLMCEKAKPCLDELLDKKKLNKDELKLLRLMVKAAQIIYNYSGDNTGLTDSEYDILYTKVVELFGEEVIGITEGVISEEETVHHNYITLRGTLDKVYALDSEDRLANDSRKTLDEWIKSSERKIESVLGKKVTLNEEDIYVFPKFDGVSVVFEYNEKNELQRALTRGYTEMNEAQDITHIFEQTMKIGPNITSDKPYGLKTEVMMSNSNFEEINESLPKPFKNSRSIVSSIINSLEASDTRFMLEIFPLRISTLDENKEDSLQELAPGAFNYPYIKCKLKDRDMIREFADTHRYVNGEFRCDGAVIYLINPELQKALGREGDKQKFEVAYKFTEERGYSKVEDVHFTTGKFGRINPIATIKPIVLKGNTIQEISLGSYHRFLKLKLAKGDKVMVLYDIIPYLAMDEEDDNCKRSKNDPFKAPKVCPDCGSELETSENGKILYCTNKGCPSRIKGKLLNYLIRMNIKGIGYETIDLLFRNEFLLTIPDFYKIEERRKKIEKLDGLGELSIANFLDELEAHKEITYATMLGSIGIEGASIKTFKKILLEITFDELLEYALDESREKEALEILTSIKGIKEKLAIRIIKGIRENAKIIDALENLLILTEDKKPEPFWYDVVFTKVRDEALEEWILAHKGLVIDSVTKNTSMVIVPKAGTESKKTKDANRWGIPIVPIESAKEFITANFLSNKFLDQE